MTENTDTERARVIGGLRKPVAWIGSGTGMSYLSVPVPIPTIFEAIRLLEADAGREAQPTREQVFRVIESNWYAYNRTQLAAQEAMADAVIALYASPSPAQEAK